MSQMKVVPVEVPWMISPSHDFVGFTGYEEREVSVEVIYFRADLSFYDVR